MNVARQSGLRQSGKSRRGDAPAKKPRLPLICSIAAAIADESIADEYGPDLITAALNAATVYHFDLAEDVVRQHDPHSLARKELLAVQEAQALAGNILGVDGVPC